MHIYYLKYIVKAVFFIDRIPDDFMQGFDKRAVTDKLNEMGLGDVAKKLNTMSFGEFNIKRSKLLLFFYLIIYVTSSVFI